MYQIRFRDNAYPPFMVTDNPCTIGRAATNHLVLPTSTVSDVQAKLVQHDGRIYLQDNKSAYGSYVNGTKVKYKELKLGDVVTLGNVHFEIVEMDAASLAATAAVNAAPPRAAVTTNGQGWQLVSDSSWLSGKVFRIVKDTIVIGRGKDCDIVIPGTHLSRRHIEIRKDKGGLIVQDLASSNGTFVNESRVNGTQTVRPGDRIRLDVYSFRVEGPADQGTSKADNSGPRKIDLSNTLQNIEALKAQEYQPKEWVFTPTSHGNRYHEVPTGKHHHTALLAFSALLGLGVLGILMYIIMNMGR